jgi:hypothetical protein
LQAFILSCCEADAVSCLSSFNRLVTPRASPMFILLLKIHRRPADPFSGEIDGYLYTVGNFDEWNATVHAVLLSVECHRPFDASTLRIG